MLGLLLGSSPTLSVPRSGVWGELSWVGGCRQACALAGVAVEVHQLGVGEAVGAALGQWVGVVDAFALGVRPLYGEVDWLAASAAVGAVAGDDLGEECTVSVVGAVGACSAGVVVVAASVVPLGGFCSSFGA